MSWYLDDSFWRVYHDAMFNEDSFARGREEVQQLLALIGNQPQQVLDVGCGPGRHSIPLALAGAQVTALDASPFLLDLARQRWQQQDSSKPCPDPEFVEADMREFSRELAFDLAICMWTSFGYFENPGDDMIVLGNMYDSLKVGGCMVLDVVAKEWLVRNLEPVHLRELDDDTLLIERPLLENDLSRLSNEWILIRGDQAQRREWGHNVYSGVELRDRLYSIGFDRVALYGSLEQDDFDLDAQRLIAVAHKDQPDTE